MRALVRTAAMFSFPPRKENREVGSRVLSGINTKYLFRLVTRDTQALCATETCRSATVESWSRALHGSDFQAISLKHTPPLALIKPEEYHELTSKIGRVKSKKERDTMAEKPTAAKQGDKSDSHQQQGGASTSHKQPQQGTGEAAPRIIRDWADI